MERNNKTTILEYSITFIICLVISFLLAVMQGIFKSYSEVVASTNWNITNENQKVFFVLTNSAFATGIVCAGFGLLVFASNGGAFDMFVYGIRRFISLFQRDVNKIKYKTFYDYRIAKEGRPKRTFFYLVAVGLFYVVLSLIFLFIYYKV